MFQPETEIRIVGVPWNVDPPSHSVPSAWTRATTSARQRGIADADEDLVEHDFVQDPDVGVVSQSPGHPRRQVAATLHHLGDPVRAERSDRGIHRECPGALRHLRDVLERITLLARRRGQVGSGDAHRGPVRGGVAHEDDAGVVRHVQPFVGIGRPRISTVVAAREVTQPWAGGCPQPERPVDVKPDVGMLADDRDDTFDRVERAGVHLAELGADDRRLGSPLQGVSQGVRVHAALVVARDPLGAAAPQSQVAEGVGDRDVNVGPDDDADGRRIDQPGLLDVPSRVPQDGVASGGQGGEVGHRRAAHEADRGPFGESEQLDEPGCDDLLDNGGARRCEIQADVLVPGGRQPIGREGRRHGAADHEAEIAWPAHRDEPRFDPRRQVVDDVAGVGAPLRKRATESPAQIVGGQVGRNPDPAIGSDER